MSPPTAAPATYRRELLLTLAGLTLAVILAYANTLRVPFVFDDAPAIERNATIRSWTTAWSPPADGSPVTGRPLLNASLALNYAIGGLQPRGYHATNVAIHLATALTLFGFARRTLMAPRAPTGARTHAMSLAFVLALIWALHPLQTSAVTYVSQRSESLAGLFSLLTLYAFARGTASSHRGAWHAFAFSFCLAGVATKEIAAAVPVLVLLWDRAFYSGTLREAWRRHRATYAALFATWVPLAILVLGTNRRGGTAGSGAGVRVVDYALTQCGAILGYLRLTVWPHPLVFDYGTFTATWTFGAFLSLVVVLALLVLAAWALVRRPSWGFLGCWFFLFLAPSSSVIPIATQTIAEHRMYLPLAAVVGMILVASVRWAAQARWWITTMAAALMLGGATVARNQDYATAESLWRDTVARRPENARAHYNLGRELLATARPADAADSFIFALQLEPAHVKAYDGLGAARLATGDVPGAVAAATRAVQIDPEFVAGRVNLGAALARAGRTDEAIREFREALRREPAAGDANLNLGLLLLHRQQPADAIPPLQQAVRALPESATARFALAQAETLAGRLDPAIGDFTAGLQIAPGDADAHHRLGLLLARAGQTGEAQSHLEEAVRLQPEFAEARANLGNVCLQNGDAGTAIAHYEAALRLNPQLPGVRENLALARAMLTNSRR